MSIPTAGSDAEFWWHDLDGGKHGPFQSERETWRALVTTLVGQRDEARRKAAVEEKWHIFYCEKLGDEITARVKDRARRR